MQLQSPLPSPSPVSSRRRSFRRSKASSCPSLFGQQGSTSTRSSRGPSSSCPSLFGQQASSSTRSSRGRSFRGIPEYEHFPRTPPPRREDSPTFAWWPLRFSSESSSSTARKEHWSSFHKRFQSSPPDKLERMYRPGWSNTSDPIMFDRQAHEQRK
jgi:hypothetical protein